MITLLTALLVQDFVSKSDVLFALTFVCDASLVLLLQVSVGLMVL